MSDAPVIISAADVGAAIPLTDPIPVGGGVIRRGASLRFAAVDGGRRRLFGGTDGIEVDVSEPPVPGGPPTWTTRITFPKKVDIAAELARAGAAWPVWWAVGEGELTVIVPRARMLIFAGFADPRLALPWFVLVHAAWSGAASDAPVAVTRRIDSRMAYNDAADAFTAEAWEADTHDQIAGELYQSWYARAVAHGWA